MGALGRRIPKDFSHVAKYPLSTLISDPLHELIVPPSNTEKNLGLPWWWKQHDQGSEGACVGFGCSSMMSVTNHKQRLINTGKNVTYRYDAPWLYHEAQLVDEWNETPPEEGTSVNAGCKILYARGHRRVQNGVTGPENSASGISAYRWATTVDEIRAAIYANLAVAIGVSWYDAFFDPYQQDGERWIKISPGDKVAGGHCVSIFRMSDRRQAFLFMNSWGNEYAPTWVGYNTMQRLLNEYGEACVIVDR